MKEDNLSPIEKCLEVIEKKNLVSQDSKALLMVSGGADSVMLVLIFEALMAKGKIGGFGVFHFNHQIYPSQNDSHEAFVRELCEKKSLPFHLASNSVPEYARVHSLSIETAARTLRYSSAREIAEIHGYDLIVTAHNLDDNAESVILSLTRGSGIRGLRGIAQKEDGLVRPMLCLRSAEIREHLEKNGISRVEDASNSSTEFARNKIRLQVAPVLESINPRFQEAVARASLAAQEHEEYILRSMSRLPFDVTRDAVRLKVCHLAPLDVYLQKNALLHMLRLLGEQQDVGRNQIDDAIRKLQKRESAFSMQLKEGVSLVGEYEYILVTRKKNEECENKTFVFSEPGVYETPWHTLELSMVAPPAELKKTPGVFYLDPSEEPFPLFLCCRSGGESFRAFGSGGSKSLKKYMIDKKLPASLRDIPLLVKRRGEIIAVLECDISESARVKPSCEKVLKLKYMKKF